MRKLGVIIAAAILIVPSMLGAEQTFGQWFVGTTDDKANVVAATTNDSGSILMEACTINAKTCRWMIAVGTACDSGSTYSALGNSESGAAILTITCDGKIPDGKYRYLLNWKEIESLIKGGKSFGMAVAAVDGKFFVHRFSLDGAAAATHVLEESFWATVKKNEAGTGTVVL